MRTRGPSRPVRSGLPLLVGIVVGGLLVAGCGGTDGPPEVAGFERSLVARDGLSAEQATCVRSYLYEEYDAEVLRAVEREGLTGVPLVRWDAYVHSMVACTLHDELVGGPPR